MWTLSKCIYKPLHSSGLDAAQCHICFIGGKKRNWMKDLPRVEVGNERTGWTIVPTKVFNVVGDTSNTSTIAAGWWTNIWETHVRKGVMTNCCTRGVWSKMFYTSSLINQHQATVIFREFAIKFRRSNIMVTIQLFVPLRVGCAMPDPYGWVGLDRLLHGTTGRYPRGIELVFWMRDVLFQINADTQYLP